MFGQITAVEFEDGYLTRVNVHIAGAEKPIVIDADDEEDAREVYEYWTNAWENGNQFLEMNS